MSEKIKTNIVSQSEAAKIANVSRQALHGMFKKDNSPFRFFTPEGKVDISSADWKSYLESRSDKTGVKIQNNKTEGSNSAKNNSHKEKITKSQDINKALKSAPASNGWDREHSLTGGYDPAQFVPSNPAQLKSLTDIVARNLEIRMKLGDLIPREMVDQYIDRISQGINQFVALGLAISTGICEKLDRVGMEREVEKLINPKIKSIIEQIIEACNNAKK